jgi:hypothetical protein
MKHAPQERSSVAKVAENGEQNRLEMFGAIGLKRGLVQTRTNADRVNHAQDLKKARALLVLPLTLMCARGMLGQLFEPTTGGRLLDCNRV